MTTTFISKFTIAESITSEPVTQSELLLNNGNVFPKFTEKLSKSAVDVWLFDAIAEDGSSAITISFFRDALAAPAGFRIAINASWADGSIWGTPVVFPESVIISEGSDIGSGPVTGVWKTDKDDSFAKFEIAADLSAATVTFNVPGKIIGSLELKSQGFDCLPRTNKDAEAAPNVYWMRPIAMADATVDITFFSQNPEGNQESRSMQFGKHERAFGGMDRSWESIGWAKAFSDSVFVRAKTGPYVFQIMLLVGKAANNHQLTAAARLYQDGRLICAPLTVLGADSGTTDEVDGDVLIMKKLFDGDGLPASFRHANVGYKLEFRSSGTDTQKWVFDTRHHRAWYRKPIGPPGSDTGASGFIISVTGGLETANELFEGWGYEGQVVLPE